MLFNSYLFILAFLPLTLLGYFILRKAGGHNLSLMFLTGMSLVFYGYFYPPYVLLLILSILVNFCLSGPIRNAEGTGRKLLFAVGLLFDLGLLGYYKYFNFFLENLNVLLAKDLPLREIILPLGISFFTFQQVSYLADVYNGECPEYSFLEYASFVTFFPQLIAGPIVLHEELIPQLKDPGNFSPSAENISCGLYGFSMGLAKKVLVADMLGPLVNLSIINLEDRSITNIIVIMLCYTLQLYFDFSGYSDMALGLGRMFNFRLPVNFQSPFRSASVREHWQRWHITMGRFFGRYVYIPLGGSRKGKLRTYLNTLITFTLSGLWHGAAWTFVLWGFLNGVCVCIDRAFGAVFEKIPKVIRVFTTFSITTILLWLFRENSIVDWGYTLLGMVRPVPGPLWNAVTETFKEHMEISLLSRFGMVSLFTAYPALPLYLFLAFCLVLVFVMPNTAERMERFSGKKRELLLTAFLLFWSIVSLSSITEFLYFNF